MRKPEMLAIPVGEGSRFATVSVGDTWRCVESPRFPTTIELVAVGMGFSFSFPPTAVGAESVLPLVMYQPRTEAPVMAWKAQWGQGTTAVAR